MCLESNHRPRVDEQARPALPPMHRTAGSSSGFAVVSAIFLLVILAALGAFMVTISSVQHTTSATDIEGSRGYWAAQAGLEWGLYQVLDPTNATVVAPANAAWPNLPGCFSPNPTTLPALAGSLVGFTISVSCAVSTHTEAGKSVAVYQLTSRATKGTVGTQNYIQRELGISTSKCRDPAAPVSPYSCS